MPIAFLAWLLGSGVVRGTEAPPGLKIVTQETFAAGTSERVDYVLDDRSRFEFRHPPDHVSASITRCDLQKSIVLNYGDRTYMSGSLSIRSMTARALLGSVHRVRPVSATAPRLVIETKTVQTGERKNAFGFTARRVVTTERRVPPHERAGAAGETVTDGWYIDLETRPACTRDYTARAVLVGHVSSNGISPEPPVVTFDDIGARENGFPIELTTTTRAPGQTFVSHKVVRELTREPLDPALFEIPSGFRDAEGFLGRLGAQMLGAWHTIASFFGFD